VLINQTYHGANCGIDHRLVGFLRKLHPWRYQQLLQRLKEVDIGNSNVLKLQQLYCNKMKKNPKTHCKN